MQAAPGTPSVLLNVMHKLLMRNPSLMFDISMIICPLNTGLKIQSRRVAAETALST